MKPNCYNRPPFKDTVIVPNGWGFAGGRRHGHTKVIPDPMSKTCQQHGQMGEATLHPEKWDCEGCRWKPAEETE